MVKFELPKLPYAYNALEPFIDEKTMIIHHTKHHQGYTDKFNKAIENLDLSSSAEEIVANYKQFDEPVRTAVRNNGGGYVNHSLFWRILKPGGSNPIGSVAVAINETFGGFEEFKKQFSAAANGIFGSGWAWLVVNKEKELEIVTTPNQDTPLSEGKVPILGLDVWEHAYYLKYQNKRADYVEGFFNIINWDEVDRLYSDAVNN